MSRRLLLVFPPLSVPTSPPLGVAMLKGYIGRVLPAWQVQVLDLNLWAFEWILQGIHQGDITLLTQAWERIGQTRDELLHAYRTLKNQHADDFYQGLSRYGAWGAAMLSLCELFNEVLAQQASHWERTGEAQDMLKALFERVAAEHPDVLGVSAIFSHQLPVGAALGRYFREQAGVPVLFGGGCFTEGVADFLAWYPRAANCVVSGDGEDALKALLENDMNPAGVPGVHYLEGGEVRFTPAQFRQDVDAFGLPDFSDLPLFDYWSPKPVVPLLLSRGCYWRKCTFCVHYFSAGDTYRVRSLEQVVAMLKAMVAQGIRHFSFVDEMIAPGYFVKLADAIMEANLDIAYYALSKPNKTFSPKVLEKMAASGCRYILWGGGGNQRVLDLMGKGTRPDEMAEVLRNARAAGIANHVYVICGFPTETRSEYEETLAFLHDNQDSVFATHRSVFSLETGSPVSKRPEAFGITETWVARKSPLGARLGCRVNAGMQMDEAVEAFRQSLPFLKGFNPFAQSLANYRDHALVVYDQCVRSQGQLPDKGQPAIMQEGLWAPLVRCI